MRALRSAISLLITKSPFSGNRSMNFVKESLSFSSVPKKSRCSASTLRTMAVVGVKLRKLFAYSQASIMKFSDLPSLILPCIPLNIPPTDMVGSRSAARYT